MYGRSRDHARPGAFTGGKRHVWINREANRGSRQARRNDRDIKESAADMPGCLSYVVAKDSADENVVWVTEVWDSAASHEVNASD